MADLSASSFCFHRSLIDTDSLTGFWRDALVLHDEKLDLNRSATVTSLRSFFFFFFFHVRPVGGNLERVKTDTLARSIISLRDRNLLTRRDTVRLDFSIFLENVSASKTSCC